LKLTYTQGQGSTELSIGHSPNVCSRLRHGNSQDADALEDLDVIAQTFDYLRMLLTKFVLKLCNYYGPYIDYASRPISGDFEIQRLTTPPESEERDDSAS
jgi:hypothetical protein